MANDCNITKATIHSLCSDALDLQNMLRMASNRQHPPEILEKISQLIQSHFDRVESLGIDIPEVNKREHEFLQDDFKLMEADWRSGRINDIFFANTLNFKLFDHFSVFLKPLLSPQSEKDFPLEFRL